jgi:uncharacterized membrane protein
MKAILAKISARVRAVVDRVKQVPSAMARAWQALSLPVRKLAVAGSGMVLAGVVQAQAAFVSINATTGFLDFDWAVPITALLNNIAAIFIGVLPIVLAGITLAWGYALMQGRLKKK